MKYSIVIIIEGESSMNREHPPIYNREIEYFVGNDEDLARKKLQDLINNGLDIFNNPEQDNFNVLCNYAFGTHEWKRHCYFYSRIIFKWPYEEFAFCDALKFDFKVAGKLFHSYESAREEAEKIANQYRWDEYQYNVLRISEGFKKREGICL